MEEEALTPFTVSFLFVGGVLPASCLRISSLKVRTMLSLKVSSTPALSTMQINPSNVPILWMTELRIRKIE